MISLVKELVKEIEIYRQLKVIQMRLNQQIIWTTSKSNWMHRIFIRRDNFQDFSCE